MSLGKVTVNNLNLSQGEVSAVERYFLFIGQGDTNQGKLLTLSTDSDLDTLLGSDDSNLKTQIQAAMDNGGEDWFACAWPIASDGSWKDAVDAAMKQVSVEAIVITDAISASTDLEDMQTKATSIMNTYRRPVWFMGVARQIDAETEAWADYQTAIKPLTTGLACENVMVVPMLWGPEPGTLAGRLCDSSVTVADTPMRVATGALEGEWSSKPTDKDGQEIDLAILKDLDAARFSVPQWYPDYDGMYWADGNLLDVDGGDYQVIENLRVVQKAMRRVYKLAVARVGDRRLNSTAKSLAQNATYLMKPLREMSHSTTILGITFPGEIKPPVEGDIVFDWATRTSVVIYMTARPYNCPKAITCNILLDLTNYATSSDD